MSITNYDRIMDEIVFNSDGLVPAIAQQHDSGEVLMMAWTNRDAIEETLNTGRVCYWSRSRNKLWKKGESSGQIQQLKEMIVDCDGDTLLLKLDQKGVACHTGRRSCFYKTVDGDTLVINQDVKVSPNELYQK
ncbi:MAG: phosphoribosyl-AMP cyclohydrolase [Rickettsiales bacterium]|nr:phosphoribosyl-AMP cyclohydrolase [Rickettsiales bacterium]